VGQSRRALAAVSPARDDHPKNCGRKVGQASQAAEELKNAVILSEAKNLSLFLLYT
jgi:hypothetical protein